MPLVDTLTVTVQDPRRAKLEGGKPFVLTSEFQPAGDQPGAIAELVAGIAAGERNQVLLGATGTGKTFTAAKIIEATQRPAIILAPNKTLAAQLYGEFKAFFPENAVEYFVSYYDYYQPEAYVARTDTYIEKESQINEQIDRMRHSATRALLERDDVIIVASVSCIYGIGSAETYGAMTQDLHAGQAYDQRQVIAHLVEQQYRRNDTGFVRGAFRVRGDLLELWPAHLEDRAWRLSFFGEELESIHEFDPLTGARTGELPRIRVYANSHYVTPRPTLQQATKNIRVELRQRLDQLVAEGKLLEAQRLEQRTTFDLEMIEATGSCAGIENYSRYLTGRKPGEPPPTLFEYIPDNAIVFADESHVSVPQIGGMYKGDFRRKFTLAEFGFRLPSCMDNRPLKFEEWDAMRPQTVFVSATPAAWELDQTGGVFTEQVIRPTGLIDPPVEIRPVSMQVDDLLDEDPQGGRPGQPRAGHRADQAHGRGPDRVPARAGHPRALHALRHRHAGADRDPARPAPRRLRRAGRHQPPARGPRHPGMRAGRHPRRRQGRVPALGDLAGADHRPRRPQRRRPRDHVRRPRHGLDGTRHRRDQPPPREADRPQSRARHHAGDHPPQRPRRARRPLPGRHRPVPHHRPDRQAAHRRQPRRPPRRPSPRMLKAAENLEFEEAARLRDEIKRLEAVDLAIADDPLARQSAIDAEVESVVPRSKAGRGGTRSYRGKSQKKMR